MTRDRKPPKNPRLGVLGRRLGETREATGRSGNRFAADVGWQQSKVSRLEAGRQVPTEAEVTTWALATGCGEEVTSELHRLLQQATTLSLRVLDAARFQDGVLAQVEELYQLEQASTLIAEYQPLLVPGLAQTAAYGKAFLTQPNRPTTAPPLHVEGILAKRSARQGMVADPCHRVVVAVNEAALWACYGDVAVQREQLHHLADLGSHVELLVEPLRETAAVIGGFELLDDCVVLEGAEGSRILSAPEVVDRFTTALGAMRRRAWTGTDAVSLVERVARGLR